MCKTGTLSFNELTQLYRMLPLRWSINFLFWRNIHPMVHHLFWSEQNLSLIRKQRLVRIECVRTELLRCCAFRPRSPEMQFRWWKQDLRAKMQGTRWRGQSRHCASTRLEGVNGIFRWHNPSGRTMTMGWTQAPTEMRTSNSKRRLVPRADELSTFMCRLSRNLGASSSWNPRSLSRSVQGLSCLYLLPLRRNKLYSSERSWRWKQSVPLKH